MPGPHDARPGGVWPAPGGGDASPRIRWGVPDALLVWLGAGILTTLVQVPVLTRSGGDVDPLYTFGLFLPAQQLAVLGALVVVSRWKGRGSLRDDFGFEVRPADASAAWLGPLLQVVLWLVLLPLALLGGEAEAQQLLQDLEQNEAVLPLVLFALGAVVLAPLAEETLYRGLLLRALLRRSSPGTAVFVSAFVFALVHYVGDPNAFRSLPALTALGVVLGWSALRTGSLSRPILIHAGFNLTTTLLVVFVPTGPMT